jgi:hypothetical protein
MFRRIVCGLLLANLLALCLNYLKLIQMTDAFYILSLSISIGAVVFAFWQPGWFYQRPPRLEEE